MAPAEAEESARTMKRELSVEDLFVPLNRLDVRHPSGPAEGESLPTSRAAEPRLTVASDVTHRSLDNRAISSCSGLSLDMAPIPEEIGFVSHLEKPKPGVALTMNCGLEECASVGLGSTASSSKDYMHSKVFSSSSKANSSATESTALQTQATSTSDEDQQVLDDRKQRRMLSNRESARRSRMRKQQHLDELRGHVAQLRAQNSQMLSSFNLASQQFAEITEENHKLRSEAMNLSHQLQRLHHIVTSHQANNGLVRGADPKQISQGPQY